MTGDVVVRRARDSDVDRVLDLLTHFDLPREFFAPWFDADPAFYPDNSWLAEEDGDLVAHLRIFPRRLRLGPAAILTVAGIGQVVTAKHARGRGHADRLLRAALDATHAAGFAYSLLWTHLPPVYAKHGFGPAPEERILATVPTKPTTIDICPAEDGELDAVAALQDRLDESRQGAAVRDTAFWRASRSWLRDDLLVAHRGGDLVGYVRRRVEADAVAVLELGAPVDDRPLGRALLSAAASPRAGRIIATLPPSLRAHVVDADARLVETHALMGRPLALPDLARALCAVWSPRLAAAGSPEEVVVSVALPAGVLGLQVRPDGVDVVRPRIDVEPLDSGQFTALVLRGCDDRTLELLGNRRDVDQLATLAPGDDFVLWRTDAF